MNWIDLLLIAVFLLAVFVGWRRGFILGSLGLLTWFGSFVLAYVFYNYTARGIAKLTDMGAWLLPVAFLVTLLLARLVLGLISRYLVRAIPEQTHISTFN